jgi:signal transduction histidine kinase
MAESRGFREALRRIGRRGLIAAGGIGILATLTFIVSKAVLSGQAASWSWWVDSSSSSQILVADKAVIVLLSLGLITAGWREWSLPAGRLLMATAALLAAGASLTADLERGGLSVNYITFLFVAAVAAMPYRPWQTALLGVGFSGLLYVVGECGPPLIPGAPHDVAVLAGGQFVHVSVITVLMVGVTALLYASRHQQYRTRRREEKLRKEVADLEATKSRFFANVSHELRTPLTVILGPLEDALDGQYGDLPDQLRDRLGAMKDQAERLHTLVDQLLQLSKLDEGRMDLDARPVDLVPFLRRMKSFFRSMADRQGVEVRIDTEGGRRRVPIRRPSSRSYRIFCRMLWSTRQRMVPSVSVRGQPMATEAAWPCPSGTPVRAFPRKYATRCSTATSAPKRKTQVPSA